MNDKITKEEYEEFLYGFNPYGPLRFGQAFLNYFSLEADPSIFYETDDNKVGEIISEKYLEK